MKGGGAANGGLQRAGAAYLMAVEPAGEGWRSAAAGYNMEALESGVSRGRRHGAAAGAARLGGCRDNVDDRKCTPSLIYTYLHMHLYMSSLRSRSLCEDQPTPKQGRSECPRSLGSGTNRDVTVCIGTACINPPNQSAGVY